MRENHDASVTSSANGGGHEQWSDLALQPDTILPSQFYGSRRDNAETEPLRRLMSAVLEDAINCFQRNAAAPGNGLRRRREYIEARQWLFGKEGSGPFSFENVCSVLGIHPGNLRRKLSQLAQGRSQSQSPRVSTVSDPSKHTAAA